MRGLKTDQYLYYYLRFLKRYQNEEELKKLQYFDHLMWRAESLEKILMLRESRVGEKGVTEEKMVAWHHWLNEHEFEQTPGDSEGQRSLACCSPWDQKELVMTSQLNNNETT